MKKIIKNAYYKFGRKGQLKPYDVKLGYIFHTEKIYDTEIFNRLKLFCKQFFNITGAKPICTIIPPTNLLLKRKMEEHRFSESDFISRVKELSNFATIGYHGHFYLNNEALDYNGIQCNNFNVIYLTEQFNNDVRWFKENRISHNNIYAAGWWFVNQELIELLLKHNFQFDFSFSKGKYFYNQFSNEIMNKNNIDIGEVFDLYVDGGNKLSCIQNFIGMHSTNFPQDFDRNMKRLIRQNHKLVGVVNAHDYDLDFDNTLNCIKYQININDVKFFSFEDLILEKPVKSVSL